jgi:hypothetical protein
MKTRTKLLIGAGAIAALCAASSFRFQSKIFLVSYGATPVIPRIEKNLKKYHVA